MFLILGVLGIVRLIPLAFVAAGGAMWGVLMLLGVAELLGRIGGRTS